MAQMGGSTFSEAEHPHSARVPAHLVGALPNSGFEQPSALAYPARALSTGLTLKWCRPVNSESVTRLFVRSLSLSFCTSLKNL